MRRNLLLAGGVSHPFEETAPVLRDIFASAGFMTDVRDDIEPALAGLADGYDLLTVHCLRWTMTQHEKYEPDRARWAFSLSQEGRAAIVAHVARGGGLLGVHTGAISFDDWSGWGETLGASWKWGQSHHPPYGRIATRVTNAEHPITQGVADFAVDDELYSDLALDPDARILAEATMADDESWFPIVTAKDGPGGRRVYSALGHDAASLKTSPHARLIAQAAQWAARDL